MIQGFKNFIMRGNVVDLAVAVVIGAAFTGVVTSFTNNIINPLIAAFGGSNVNGLGFRLVGSNPKTLIDIGAVLTALVNFLIIGATVYFVVVVPMSRLQDRMARDADAETPAPSDEAKLLTEIRDLLREEGRR